MQTIGVRNRVHHGEFENRELSVCFGRFLSHQGHFLVTIFYSMYYRQACMLLQVYVFYIGLKIIGAQILRIEIIIANLPFQKIYINIKIDTDRQVRYNTIVKTVHTVKLLLFSSAVRGLSVSYRVNTDRKAETHENYRTSINKQFKTGKQCSALKNIKSLKKPGELKILIKRLKIIQSLINQWQYSSCIAYYHQLSVNSF